jgi:hypothetical protein
MPMLLPRSLALRERHSSLIDVTLDPAQARAVTLLPGRALLVLGEAGHGKTTVALHRLAHLYREARGRFRAAVIVPAEGLKGLLQPLVTRLGADVNVRLYDAWARAQGRRAFPDAPRRASRDATAGVIRLKRHAEVRFAIAEIAKGPPGVADDDADAPPPETTARAVRADLQHLFGDRLLVEAIARRASLPDHVVREVLEHTRVQFGDRAEREYAHVDKKRLVAVDRRSLDEGTSSGDAATIDSEDFAVLFEIDRARAAREGVVATAPRPFDCVVVDEAQELSPLELALVGRSVAPGGSLVVAGDADQQTDATTCFVGWDHAMRELSCDDFERVTLDIGYRCAPHVVALARRALDPSDDPARDAIDFESPDDFARAIAVDLETIDENDPSATVAIIARTPALARRVSGAIAGLARARLVLDGRFLKGAGAFVTTVDQVKGLEFDYVVVPDARVAYGVEDAASRRALYVAVTRARHQAVLANCRSVS